jgi:hypothetical protein
MSRPESPLSLPLCVCAYECVRISPLAASTWTSSLTRSRCKTPPYCLSIPLIHYRRFNLGFLDPRPRPVGAAHYTGRVDGQGKGNAACIPGPEAFPHRSSNAGLSCSQTRRCILHVLMRRLSSPRD